VSELWGGSRGWERPDDQPQDQQRADDERAAEAWSRLLYDDDDGDPGLPELGPSERGEQEQPSGPERGAPRPDTELDVRDGPSPIAQQITDHAYSKHVERGGEYPWIRTPEQFAQLVDRILDAPSDRKPLPADRMAYWHEDSGTIVIVNGPRPDRSTAFRPDTGKEYFDEL